MRLTEGAILIPQGCDYEFTITAYDEDGSVQDLTGYEARFRVADKTISKTYIDIYKDEDSEVGECVVDTAKGVVTVRIKPHDKNKLPTNNEVGEEATVQANNVYSIVLVEQLEDGTEGKIIKAVQADCYTEAEL